MLRKILNTVVAACLAVAGASIASRASNIPLFSGSLVPQCEESSQTVSCLNYLIGEINVGVAGWYASQPGPIASAATTNLQNLASLTIPTGTLANSTQSLRLTCSGITASNTHTKAVGLYVGTTVVSTANFAASGAPWRLDLLVTLAQASPPTSSVYSGLANAGSTAVTPQVLTVGQNTTDSYGGALTAGCETLQGTASASDVTLENFLIEKVQ